MSPTLVFGDDRSSGSDVAWQWIELHEWPGWRLQVLTAHTPGFGPPPTPASVELHEWQPDIPRVPRDASGFIEVRHLTAELDPRLALLEPADLLVIGPRGPGLAKALRLGSTAEWLLQVPPHPMIIARRAIPVHRVLVGHDGSPHAQLVTTTLATLPWVRQLTVTVVVAADGRADVERATTAAVDAFASTSASVDVVHAHGHPTAALLGEIDRRAPDLVALGSRGLTGFRRAYLGSTTSAVVRGTQCTVLVACADVFDR
ncbi:MAG TPA: universal stress protein [Acidimicrobiales bacterium]|jgi:nucleotide-binding universal stress UspA family protein|nr:universal stress protein [Acidimicrobiales bacterium]